MQNRLKLYPRKQYWHWQKSKSAKGPNKKKWEVEGQRKQSVCVCLCVCVCLSERHNMTNFSYIFGREEEGLGLIHSSLILKRLRTTIWNRGLGGRGKTTRVMWRVSNKDSMKGVSHPPSISPATCPSGPRPGPTAPPLGRHRAPGNTSDPTPHSGEAAGAGAVQSDALGFCEIPPPAQVLLRLLEEMRTRGTEAIIKIRTEGNFPEMKTILQ